MAREAVVAAVTEDPQATRRLADAGPITGTAAPQSAPPARIDASHAPGQPPGTAAAIPTTTVTVTIASPTADLEAATTKLLRQARERLTATGGAGTADDRELTGLVVSEPRESTDCYGQVWYWFRGTLQVSEAPRVGDGADDCLREQATPGSRAPSGSASDPAPGCDRAEEWQARASRPTQAGRLAAVSAWPLRPVPPQYGNGWRCSLPTAAAAARARRDLRVRLQRASAAGHCTVDAGEDLLLVFEELSSNAFRHGAGAVDVTIAASAAGWLLVISDEAPERAPVPAMGRDRPLSGLGLDMVAGLSRDFGWQPGRSRKRVWAELPVRG